MNLTIQNLLARYRDRILTPDELIKSLLKNCQNDENSVWIRLLTEEELEPYLRDLDGESPDSQPLFGIPFAIKDNIDLAGIPTTAGCPEYAYVPETSAFVVEQLIKAGAIPLGKTNLDQFATGLVGTRSPHGACRNSFNPDYISGGSSSGSAVAVAKGMCSFSLGTDTAGSGRVPAAFNNILGVKPSRGLLSTRGVVPACRSLDCISAFCLSADDGRRIMDVAAVFDGEDPFSRRHPLRSGSLFRKDSFTFGVPRQQDLAFFGNNDYALAFSHAVYLLTSMGGTKVEVDFTPFLHAAKLLYEGPWVTERTVAVGTFLKENPDAGFPVTLEIICSGKSWSADELFSAMYTLQALKKKTDALMEKIDFLVTPTAGTCYTIDEVNADPIALNSNLGYYTNYMNLLDYCSLAVPTEKTSPVPFGVTLVGRAFDDPLLLAAGAALHAESGLAMGCGTDGPPPYPVEPEKDKLLLAVCGAHLEGLPLHHQLTDLKAGFVCRTRTAHAYRMYALSTTPPKPGLVRDELHGAGIEVEVYALSPSAFGTFTSMVPHPLGIGKLELADGTWVPGFIAEPVVSQTGMEITQFGGWRAFLAEARKHEAG